MSKNIFLLSFILISLCLVSCSKANDQSFQPTYEVGFEEDDEIYTSILEVTIKEEYSSQNAKFSVESFPDTDLSYVANFKNNYSSEGRNELVVVLKNPTKNNRQTNIKVLKNNTYVYDVRTVNVPKSNVSTSKSYLNNSYHTIFKYYPNWNPNLRRMIFTSFGKDMDDYPNNAHEFTKSDFPELEIDSITTCMYPTDFNMYYEVAYIVLQDNSLENTLLSFLSVRNSTLVSSVSFDADGEGT